jgi:hypothetical protein
MRLFRHLTFSNVIALIALFVALGGAAYAGSKLNGKNIVNTSIGGGKLKNETITARQIKKGTITGDQIAANSISSSSINLTTLGTVPSATNAQTAQSATTATTATNATKAETATSATEAGNAKHATEAGTATTAANATHATTAGEAESLEGTTAQELTLSCSSTTSFYGGMCWDKANRQPKIWLMALKTCADADGRLPTISELIAFVLFDQSNAFEEDVWSGDLADVVGPAEEVLTSDETGRAKEEGANLLGYRCVFPLSN